MKAIVFFFTVLLVAIQTTCLAGEDNVRNQRQALTDCSANVTQIIASITTYLSNYSRNAAGLRNYSRNIPCQLAVNATAGCCFTSNVLEFTTVKVVSRECNVTVPPPCSSGASSELHFGLTSAGLFAVASFLIRL